MGKPLFACDNLALAVLQGCINEKRIKEPDYEALEEEHPYADDADSYNEMNTGVRAALIDLLAKKAAAISSLEKLSWWVPEDVMEACWPEWDGETDEFEITSFAGIERCGLLRVITIQHLNKPVDLSPLTKLPELQELSLPFAPKMTAKGWSKLLEIPGLKKVTAKLDDPLTKKLVAKGVAVKAE